MTARIDEAREVAEAVESMLIRLGSPLQDWAARDQLRSIILAVFVKRDAPVSPQLPSGIREMAWDLAYETIRRYDRHEMVVTVAILYGIILRAMQQAVEAAQKEKNV